MTQLDIRPGAARVEHVAETAGVVKTYDSGACALRGVSAGFPRGRFTAITGPSGSGKPTLVRCPAGLDRVTSGAVPVAGKDLSRLSDRRRAKLRRERPGVVFRSADLLPTLTAEENIRLTGHLTSHMLDEDRLAGGLVVSASVGGQGFGGGAA